MRRVIVVLLLVLTLSLLLVPACKKVYYVCPDGSIVKDAARCQSQIITISQRTAEKYASNFVSGYANVFNARVTKVSSYKENGSWFVSFIIGKTGEGAYETTVKVDGKKGMVSCFKNCDYINASS